MIKPVLMSSQTVVAALLLAGMSFWNPVATAASPSSMAGIYSGAITNYRFPGPVASTPEQLFGAVAPTGNGYFISAAQASSNIRVFRYLTGQGEVTSPEYEVPTGGRAVARGVQKWKIEIKAVSVGASLYDLLGQFNRVDGYAALTLRMLPLTHRPISLANRSGAYKGLDVNRHTSVRITLHSGGRLEGTDASGCGISGRLTRVDNRDLFKARVKFAGPPTCLGEMAGVAFFDTRNWTGRSSGAMRPYLYLIGANSEFSHGFAMVLTYWNE